MYKKSSEFYTLARPQFTNKRVKIQFRTNEFCNPGSEQNDTIYVLTDE
jgi:hypothetical protein